MCDIRIYVYLQERLLSGLYYFLSFFISLNHEYFHYLELIYYLSFSMLKKKNKYKFVFPDVLDKNIMLVYWFFFFYFCNEFFWLYFFGFITPNILQSLITFLVKHHCSLMILRWFIFALECFVVPIRYFLERTSVSRWFVSLESRDVCVGSIGFNWVSGGFFGYYGYMTFGTYKEEKHTLLLVLLSI